MSFNFGDVLGRAWKITWKYRALWLFGMLSSCGQGGSSSNYRQSSSQSGQNPLPLEMQRQILDATNQFSHWLPHNTWFIFALLAFALIAILLQIVANTIGTVGVVRGAFHADSGPETLGIGPLFRESLGYFWRMIGMGLLVWLPFFILFIGLMIVFVASAVAMGSNPTSLGGAAVLFLIGFCCCLFPIIIALGLFYTLAQRALLVDDLSIFESLQRGWQVLTGNLVNILGVGFLLFLIGLGVGLVISIPIFIAVVPVMMQFLNGMIHSWQPFIIAAVAVLVYSPFHWFFNGILRTFVESVWTLTYLEIHPKPAAPVMPIPAEANA